MKGSVSENAVWVFGLPQDGQAPPPWTKESRIIISISASREAKVHVRLPVFLNTLLTPLLKDAVCLITGVTQGGTFLNQHILRSEPLTCVAKTLIQFIEMRP